VKTGGSGCICPESALLRALITHIVLSRNEVVVMDMEAGIEHLGRATAGAVDKLIVVVEPGQRSIDTARHIRRLASEIGLKTIALVGNKIRGEKDRAHLEKNLSDFEFLGFMPYDDALVEADLNGVSPFTVNTEAKTIAYDMISRIG
jgi:CO dehydrogenase maturation factor